MNVSRQIICFVATSLVAISVLGQQGSVASQTTLKLTDREGKHLGRGESRRRSYVQARIAAPSALGGMFEKIGSTFGHDVFRWALLTIRTA
jgi:hypothetical protein